MLFLVVDITRYLWQFITAQAQDAITLLPFKSEPGSDFLVDPKGRRPFHLPDELSDQNSRREALAGARGPASRCDESGDPPRVFVSSLINASNRSRHTRLTSGSRDRVVQTK